VFINIRKTQIKELEYCDSKLKKKKKKKRKEKTFFAHFHTLLRLEYTCEYSDDLNQEVWLIHPPVFQCI